MNQDTEKLRLSLYRLIQGVDACRGDFMKQLGHLKGMLSVIVDFMMELKKSA